jgi:hypothetical protein
VAVFKVGDTLKNMQSKLAASNLVVTPVLIGEPVSAQPDHQKPYAAIWINSTRVFQVTLSSIREVQSVMVRLFRYHFTSPEENEIILADTSARLVEDFCGDFDLGGTVGYVDVGGAHSDGIGSEWGHVELGNIIYRVADITVPIVINDSATLTA